MREILEFVELGKERGKLAHQLSGGMQRRLNLAATLLHNPDLIFLDKPQGLPALDLLKNGCTGFYASIWAMKTCLPDPRISIFAGRCNL
jgi:ABC-type nitrate/sulfonate/bicarbonate transport system ATPase subunit